MSKRRKVLEYIFPIRQVSKAATSVREASRSVKGAVMGAASSGRTEDLHPDDVRRIEDSRERFEAMYQLHGWTPGEIEQQIRAVRATKVVALCFGSAIFVSSLGVILFVKPLLWFVALPLGGCLTMLCAAQSFKYALYEAQLKERRFLNAKEFLGLPDFWSRLIG